MATAGHLVTMTGVLFFYITIFDSHRDKKLSTPLNFMIPRVNKRVLYYLHKITHLTLEKKNMRIFQINQFEFILLKMQQLI